MAHTEQSDLTLSYTKYMLFWDAVSQEKHIISNKLDTGKFEWEIFFLF